MKKIKEDGRLTLSTADLIASQVILDMFAISMNAGKRTNEKFLQFHGSCSNSFFDTSNAQANKHN